MSEFPPASEATDAPAPLSKLLRVISRCFFTFAPFPSGNFSPTGRELYVSRPTPLRTLASEVTIRRSGLRYIIVAP
jgi:hypothetical protein